MTKLRLSIALMVLFTPGVVCAEKGAVRSDMFTSVQRRVPLESNEPGDLYSELKDWDVLEKILPHHQSFASVVFGGNDDQYSVAVFSGEDEPSDKMVDQLKQYIRFRWYGLSLDTSIKLMKDGDRKMPSGIGESELALIRKRYPSLPVASLRKVDVYHPIGFPWINDKDRIFVLTDKEISLMLRIRKNGEQSVPILYIVDSLEFQGEYVDVARAIARELIDEFDKRQAAGSPWRAQAYWSELKEALKMKGILWRAPDELNSDVVWD